MKNPFFQIACLYLAFVIYGSLVPLNFRPIPWSAAVHHIQHIPYLRLGIGSRADWVANILLYIPLAFFGTAVVTHQRRVVERIVYSVFMLVACLAIAFGVEFVQLFFPPRTVSINDLIAESLGSIIGVLAWNIAGDYVVKQLKHIKLGNFLSVKAAIFFYIVIYAGLSLFPFDFVTSLQELELKYSGEDIAFSQCGDTLLRCSVRYGVEASAVIPLAVLICLLPTMPYQLTLNVLIGFMLGILIEGGQIFLVSGVAQGASVLCRMLGMAAGVVGYRWARRFAENGNGLILLKNATKWLVLPYVVLVLAINGWFDYDWHAWPVALKKLHATYFLPFFYFYYTSEPVALVSLLSNLGMYLPAGVFFWALNVNRAKTGPAWQAGVYAAAFASIIEISKLFLDGKHADPTDVLIAFAAGFGVHKIADRILLWINAGNATGINGNRLCLEQAATHDNLVNSVKKLVTGLNPYAIIAALVAAGAVVYLLLKYPLSPWILALFLIGYGYFLSKKPDGWLIAVPALLPVMDFAPWTGWFFTDEFDLTILATLAVCWSRKQRGKIPWPGLSRLAVVLLVLVYSVSVMRGLLPLPQPDANAFNNYYSHYNSLRMAKGVFWAFLLAPCLFTAFKQNPQAKSFLTLGILLGLTAMLTFSVIERSVFTGLWNFSIPYRISALFSSMHTGGGHIEAYLVLTLPFIGLMFFYPPRWAKVAALMLFSAGVYVLLATFSRGGYLAFAVEFLVLLAGMAVYKNSQLRTEQRLGCWQPVAAGLVVVSITGLLFIPVIQGRVVQQRFSTVSEDKVIREHHWLDALNMMDNGWATSLFGMGVGSYPRAYFLSNNENVVPGSYKIETESGHRYLRLKGGDALYMGQYIDFKADRYYRLAMDLRSPNGKAVSLEIPICEKSLLYSFNCISPSITTTNQSGWQTHERDIFSGKVGFKHFGIGKPMQLALFAGYDPETVIDIDNIELIDETGKNLLANGNFSHDLDRWLFSTDNHLPWHVKNIWVQVYFDQGWLGVISLAALFLAATVKLFDRIRQSPEASVYLSALAGFTVVGCVDSSFDAPRLTLLFLLIITVSLLEDGHTVKRAVFK